MKGRHRDWRPDFFMHLDEVAFGFEGGSQFGQIDRKLRALTQCAHQLTHLANHHHGTCVRIVVGQVHYFSNDLPIQTERLMHPGGFQGLRQAVAQTQEELAATLGVGQDTISRLEKRSDMLLSTLRRYVEAMGGKLELVAKFPDRPPLVIDHLAEETSARHKTHA